MEIDVDFVDWCSFVLDTCIKTGNTFNILQSSLAGTLTNELKVNNPHNQASFYGDSTFSYGIYYALEELKKVGLMDNDGEKSPFWNITNAGRDYAADLTPLWWQICQEKLNVEYEQFLSVVNRLSQKMAPDHAWLEMVRYQTFLTELAGSEILPNLWPIARGLKQWGFVSGIFTMDGKFDLISTYKGLVWETRRSFTIESKFIDDLLKDWETTSVEFKQYLYIKTVEQKAEFIKDVLSLVNTKASGRRWMIIGFNNKTHDYFGPPNPDLNQDDFERLIGEYTNPYVEVQYEVVEYRKGHVGKLEVLRDPKKLPYRVAKSLGDKLKGDKKQIFKGQVFVRHGSQAVVARGTELKELVDEGKQARQSL